MSTSTDIVTISIGGNDVGFSDYASYCATQGECGENNPHYENAFEIMDESLPTDLRTVFQGILNRASSGKLYVLGYPYLVDPSASCVSFGWSDDLGALELTDSLNDTIHEAVTAVNNDSVHPTNNGRIEYIDPTQAGGPFENHYLCSTVPYFNSVVTSITDLDVDEEYSFHPNELGQAAYAALLEEAID